jgi:hypothetical protein
MDFPILSFSIKPVGINTTNIQAPFSILIYSSIVLENVVLSIFLFSIIKETLYSVGLTLVITRECTVSTTHFSIIVLDVSVKITTQLIFAFSYYTIIYFCYNRRGIFYRIFFPSIPTRSCIYNLLFYLFPPDNNLNSTPQNILP